jgi:hypothetical protein
MINEVEARPLRIDLGGGAGGPLGFGAYKAFAGAGEVIGQGIGQEAGIIPSIFGGPEGDRLTNGKGP